MPPKRKLEKNQDLEESSSSDENPPKALNTESKLAHKTVSKSARNKLVAVKQEPETSRIDESEETSAIDTATSLELLKQVIEGLCNAIKSKDNNLNTVTKRLTGVEEELERLQYEIILTDMKKFKETTEQANSAKDISSFLTNLQHQFFVLKTQWKTFESSWNHKFKAMEKSFAEQQKDMSTSTEKELKAVKMELERLKNTPASINSQPSQPFFLGPGQRMMGPYGPTYGVDYSRFAPPTPPRLPPRVENNKK